MKEKIKEIQSYLSLIVAIIAILGWFYTYVSNRVSDKKDKEFLQRDIIEIKANVKTIHETQIQDGKEKAAMQQYIIGHTQLHESLH